MADEVKRGRGRPPGSKTFRPDPPRKASRLLDLINNAYSDAEVVARYKSLSPAMQFKYRSMMEPRAKEEQAGPNVFQLVIEGLPPICPRCGFRSADQDAPVVAVNPEVKEV